MERGPDSSAIQHHGTRRARWGMLATTVVMAVALVGTALGSYLETREAARAIAHAEAGNLFRATRAALVQTREEPQDVLDELIASLEPQGLAYIQVLSGLEVVAEAGSALDPERRAQPLSLERGVTVLDLGDRLRVEGAMGPPRRGEMRGRRPPRDLGRADRGPGRIVIEYEPVMAQALARGAVTQLVVSGAAAALLLLVALIFWRLAARAERAEAQVARARRLAALGEMSAVLGHEIRNPLAALKGHAQLVVERLDPEHRAGKSAHRVVREAKRLEALVGQVLDFARTGSVAPEEADPGAALRAAAELVSDPRVTVETAAAPAYWTFDRPRLEQVLTNVLKNALESSPDGLAVDARCAAEGQELVFEIRDRGPGFPEEWSEEAFEPFRTTRIHGTGLGLAIASRIVEAHRGRISLGRHPEGGAIVRIALPALGVRARDHAAAMA